MNKLLCFDDGRILMERIHTNTFKLVQVVMWIVVPLLRLGALGIGVINIEYIQWNKYNNKKRKEEFKKSKFGSSRS